jgi:hypothetical protein
MPSAKAEEEEAEKVKTDLCIPIILYFKPVYNIWTNYILDNEF